MSENISLIKNKQKGFSRSIKKTKSKIQKGQIKISNKVPRRSIRKIPSSQTGFLYLSNIPHGFYEKQLFGYFSQFGNVIKVRVARSKKTGNSKGHAFIQFEQEDVAKIAAETMDNYLMGNRLLKAKLLPHDEKTQNLFKKPNFSKEHYPTKVRQQRFKKSYNAPMSEKQVADKVKKSLKHIADITKKLKEVGIDYDFEPVHVPPTLNIKTKEQEIDLDDSSSEDIVFTPPEEMNKRLKSEKENTPKKTKKDKKIKTVKSSKTATIKKPKKVETKAKKQKKDNTSVKEKKIKSKKNKITATPEKSVKKVIKKKNPKQKTETKSVVKKSKKASTISEKKANLMVELIKTSNQVKKVNKIEKKKNKTK